MSTIKKFWSELTFVGLGKNLGFLYCLSMMSASYQEMYDQLTKPGRAPRAEVFGPVWTVLYLLIAFTYGYVAYLYWRRMIPRYVLIPFGLNLIANFLFTYFQFGLQDMLLATIDILLIVATIVRSMIAIRPYKRWIAVLQLPYLAWVCIALVLQVEILFLNI